MARGKHRRRARKDMHTRTLTVSRKRSLGAAINRVFSRFFLNDMVERVSATFVMALVPTLYTSIPWFEPDLSEPSKIGLASAAALGSVTKAIGARFIGDKDTAAWLPRRADTPEPAESAPVIGAEYEMPPQPEIIMPSVTPPTVNMPEPIVKHRDEA